MKYIIFAVALLLAVSACKEKTASHPITDMEGRFRTRIDRIELAISDPQRADEVKAAYIDLEKWFRNYKDHMIRAKTSMDALERTPDATEDDFRLLLDEAKAAEGKRFEEYISIQARIRAKTSEREFAKLNAMN